MKILTLTAENFMRLAAVEITPDGNMVQITGRNGMGKSSVLNAIWAAIGGTSHILSQPIRKGAKEARIKLDLGTDGSTEIVVTRTFKKTEDGETTTRLTVENADGFKAPQPQKMLDSLVSALAFDPLAFLRMKPADQFEELRRFVPDVDFPALDAANATDYEARRSINRSMSESTSAANQIEVPWEDLPAQAIDEAALISELEAAGARNADIETRKSNRLIAQEKIDGAGRKVADQSKSFEDKKAEINKRRDLRVARIKDEITGLEREITAVIEQADRDVDEASQFMIDVNAATEKEATALKQRLEAAGPLPEPIETAPIRQRIDAAKITNAAIAQRDLKLRHTESAADLKRQSEALTTAMEAREKQKRDAIAAAKLPVPGLGFGQGVITFNELPFDQASDAEQLRVSIAIAMAANARLRVCRVRDGSLLDEDGLRLLAAMADEADVQVWLERVSNDGKTGFVLEDGQLASATQGSLV